MDGRVDRLIYDGDAGQAPRGPFCRPALSGLDAESHQ